MSAHIEELPQLFLIKFWFLEIRRKCDSFMFFYFDFTIVGRKIQLLGEFDAFVGHDEDRS